MKFQKLDSKQVPQVIILGVLSVGVVGYGIYNVVGSVSGAPAPKPAAETRGTDQEQMARANTAATGEAAGAAAAQPIPGVQLPGQYNPDPFKPARQLTPPKKVSKAATVSVKPSSPTRVAAPPRRDFRMGPLPLPGAASAFPPITAPTAVPPVPLVSPGPVRPVVAMMGVIDVEEGDDMALLEFQGEQQIVKVGQLVADYRIHEIHFDRIVLVRGKDRFVVFLGAPSSDKPAGTRSPETA